MQKRMRISLVAALAAVAGIAFASGSIDTPVQLTKAIPAMPSLASWSSSWDSPSASASQNQLAAAALADPVNPCTESPNGQNIRVGNPPGGPPRFNRNGQPWNMRSMQIRGFVSSIPTAQFLEDTQDIGGNTIAAQNIYGEAELQAAWQTFGANTLRFQVSQHDLDANSPRNSEFGQMPAYDPAYKTKVINAIQLARSKCFVVIISMQAQKRSGVIERKTISSLSTKRAWNNLLSGAGAFIVEDRGIMLEIYNEPGGPDQVVTPVLWSKWAHASQNNPAYEGPSSDPNNQVFGMQPMIDHLRGPRASKNVLIVDGLKIADTFEQVDTLATPLSDTSLGFDTQQLVYAVHPYIRERLNDTATQWDARFGFLRNGAANGRPPVMAIATEWGAGQFEEGLGLGGPPNPPGWDVAVRLLNYMRTKGIPMGAGAMDIPGVMSQNPMPSNLVWTPTNYDNWTQNDCGESRNNAGLLIAKLFRDNYSVALVKADGTTPGETTPVWCS